MKLLIRAFLGSMALIGAATTAHAQEGQPSQETQWAYQKYLIAGMTLEVHDKCPLLSDAERQALKSASDRYRDVLKAASYIDPAAKALSSFKGQWAKFNCAKAAEEQQLQQTLLNRSLIVDEYLLAIERSGLESCGDMDTAALSKLRELTTAVEQRMQTRDDYAAVNTWATEAGETLQGRCSSPITSAPNLLMYDPVGAVLVPATKMMQAD